jgi:DNA polymerase-3 subunit beta
MKISLLQENLAKGLNLVSRAIAARSTLPILGNVLLATDAARLKLMATNLEIGLTCWLGAKVDEDGVTTVPARTFVDLINALPPDRVDLELAIKTQTLNVKCERFTNNLKGIAADEFPIWSSFEDARPIEIAPDVLRTLIEQTAFAAASDESRPVLTGVHVKFNGHTATFEAADGVRAAIRIVQLATSVDEPLDAVIPARALIELARLLNDDWLDQTEPVRLAVTPQHHQIVFRLTQAELVTQLLDGPFPNIDQVIPRSTPTTTMVDSLLLLRACKAVNVFAREAANIARLDFAPTTLTLSAQSAESGDNESVLDVALDGEPLQIAFNVKLLMEALQAAGGEQVAFGLVNPGAPCLIRPLGDESYTQVIMPLQVK